MSKLSKSDPDMYLASREALIRLLNDESSGLKVQITNLTVREAHAADTIIQLKIKAHEKLTKTVGYQQKILKQLEEIDGLKKQAHNVRKGLDEYKAKMIAMEADKEDMGEKLDLAVDALRYIRDRGKDAWEGWSEELADCTLERFFDDKPKFDRKPCTSGLHFLLGDPTEIQTCVWCGLKVRDEQT